MAMSNLPMRRRGQRTWPIPLTAALIAALSTGIVCAEVVPLVTHNDRCEIVVETSQPDEHFYLVVGSLADAARTCRVSVRTEATNQAPHLSAAESTTPPPWRALVEEQAARQEKARQLQPPTVFTPAAAPPQTRIFHVFIQDRALENPAHYAAVSADLRAVGRHAQVYVDRDVTSQANLDALIEDILHTFDSEVFPWATRHLGRAQDVDRDGRFTILLTPWLGKMRGGAVSVDGFVRGSDFALDVAAPFSNRCDMMYINSQLKPGPHLRTLLAHEYTHAVVYCEHALENYLPGVARQDEEGWLNEGLAHLVEEQMAHGWSNLDYRIAAYLAAPEHYPLVVPDYFQAGLWRVAGTRGATFLFLRSCREFYGMSLLTRLARSNLAGIANLEAATRVRFEDLFRRWAVGQLENGLDWTRQAGLDARCAAPRCHDVALGGERRAFTLAGTAVLYVRLHSGAATRTRVIVQGQAGAAMQVTLIRPAPSSPWLELGCLDSANDGHIRLQLTAHGTDLRIDAGGWEPTPPTATAGGATGMVVGPKLASWFPALDLKKGVPIVSRDIVVPEPARVSTRTFRVAAHDAAGKIIVAWAVLPRTETAAGSSQ